MDALKKLEKVLVIDDSLMDRTIMKLHLKKLGIVQEPMLIENTNEALRYLKDLEATPENLPHLIFVDVNMPLMNGFEFLEEYTLLPEAVKRKCIYMLSSSLNPQDRDQASNSPYVVKFLEKPITKEVLRSL